MAVPACRQQLGRDDANRPTILSVIEQAIAQQPEEMPHGPRGRKQRKVFDILADYCYQNANQNDAFDLFDKIRHTRLPVGRWAGNQMLALGMVYYRLRDAF